MLVGDVPERACLRQPEACGHSQYWVRASIGEQSLCRACVAISKQ